MRLFLITLLSVTSLFGFFDSVSTFSADFEQRITDDQNKSIVYKGHIQTKRPNMALWNYVTPVEKQIYIREYKVVIIEPDLEQAIIKKVRNDIDLFTILTSAISIGNDHYEAHYRDMKFLITMEKDLIQSISYEDVFQNRVVILFSGQSINKAIDDTVFKAMIPSDYDILRD